MDSQREHARQLLSYLAPDQVAEIGEDEERAVVEAREWRRENKPIPHGEVLAEFGLTMADFDRMGQTRLPEERAIPAPNCE